MLYRIAHILRDKFPWIWESIGVINSFFFVLIYGKRMKKIKGILKAFSLSSNQVECLLNSLRQPLTSLNLMALMINLYQS